MNFLYRHEKKRVLWPLILLSLCLIVVSIAVISCSTSSYDTPITTQTSSGLISAETLKTWIDSGVVNGTGFDRVVILDVTSYATYSAGHIPGALYVDSSTINQTRMEGPATDINMALSGPNMDALIKKNGIDKNTTIVFTTGANIGATGPSILNATRAYWTFRYWGFPKERLKFLDGVNFAWAALYPLTTDIPPAPVSSTYSVKNNVQFRSDLRTSLVEMIQVADANNANPNDLIPVVDMRSSETDGSYAGKRGNTKGPFSPSASNIYTVFEGHVKGGSALLYTDMLTNVTSTVSAATDLRFKSKETLAAMFNAVGVNGTKTTHVY